MLRSLVAPVQKAAPGEITIRRNLTTESLDEALANGEMMWIDAVDPTRDEIQWLEQTFNLHPVVVSDLYREDRRPTLLIYPDYLFLSLFQAQIQQDQVKSQEVHCLVGENFYITVRRTSSTAVNIAYDVAAQNIIYWQQGPVYFMYLTAQHIIDSYYPLLDRISHRLSDFETRLFYEDEDIPRYYVYHIKQQLITLRQLVAPQREVLSSIIGESRIAQNSEIRELFRHLYERILRVYDVIDAQRDLWSNVLDLMQSQEAAKMANAVNRLTIFSMIFLPLTFLMGLFGLNFVTTQPELRIPLPGQDVFILLIFICLVLSMIIAVVFRRRGWL